MKLEKEIKQKKFDNEFQKLIVNIIYTGGWLNAINSKRLKKFGISPQQYNVLRILRGQYPLPVTVNLLKERMLDRMSNASRLVEKLRLKGCVERAVCPSDRRAVDVIITQKGLDLLAEIDSGAKKFEKHFKSLAKSEAKKLNQLLDKLRG
ncbi:MAG: MarR family winged helix-turn-helix transcriptional regulator [Candidatus Glassbacteria bacterium]